MEKSSVENTKVTGPTDHFHFQLSVDFDHFDEMLFPCVHFNNSNGRNNFIDQSNPVIRFS